MDRLQVAKHVRDACLKAAAEAYEDAGVQGLCAEGRWEAALSALRRLDVQTIVQELAANSGTRSD